MSSRFQLANAIRALSMDAIQNANSGHPGAPMGMASNTTPITLSGQIETVLYCRMGTDQCLYTHCFTSLVTVLALTI